MNLTTEVKLKEQDQLNYAQSISLQPGALQRNVVLMAGGRHLRRQLKVKKTKIKII